MVEKKHKFLYTGALLLGLLIIAFAVIATSGSTATASGSNNDVAPAWWTPRPMPTGTWVMPTRPPMPTGTCVWPTREPWPTRPPMATRTPDPYRTPMATRTPWTWPTRPPMATRTPYTGPTYTPHPPMATRTMRPMPTGTWVMPTRAPRPTPVMWLMPRVQYQFATPGTTATYHNVLGNNFQAATTVDLTVDSMGQWPVTVDPTQIVAQPHETAGITVEVSVPISPTRWWDVERLQATTETSPTFRTYAAFITIAGRREYSDVPAGSWVDGPVQYLTSRNVVSGYSDGTFRPNDIVTRAQFAKILVGAMGWELVNPSQPTFSDVSASDWAYSYVETAVAHGVLSGYTDGTFRPGNAVTRAQAAKMVVLANNWVLLTDVGSFSDVSASDWFAVYAETVNSAEVMAGYSDGTFRPYASATRGQVAKILTLGLYSEPLTGNR